MNYEEFKEQKKLSEQRKSKREQKAATLWGKRPEKKKRKSSRKALVRKADAAFSLKIRELYPVSFFSGKPTECCFHIITRSKYAVRWSLNNAVGSTMGENYEMEFNPHKFISILIQKRGLAWYEDLVRMSNTVRKHSREDLEAIAALGHDAAQFHPKGTW